MEDNEPTLMKIELSDSLRLDDDDIVRLRRSSEDHFVERKSFGDWGRDAVKTVVAFANSIPLGQPGYFFIGVKDNGEVERTNHNLDQIQKTLAEKLKSVYPRIPYVAKALSEDGAHYLLVIVHGSENRPHFAGPSYIREGSQSIPASEEQFRLLIAQRLSKVSELLKWRGKPVTVEHVVSATYGNYASQVRTPSMATLTGCNEFYVTVSDKDKTFSYTLADIELSFDHTENRLKLELRY